MKLGMPTMADQIAQAATAFHQELTGREPKSVNVVLCGDTLVITLYGALCPAEQQAMTRSSDGAARLQEYRRRLFFNGFDTLRQDLRRITGMDVRDAAEGAELTPEAVVQVFASGTMVQLFLLSGKVSCDGFSSSGDA